MELLNTFNVLLISSCRVVQENGRPRVYLHNVIYVFLVPLVVVLGIVVVAFIDFNRRSMFYLESTAQLFGGIKNGALTCSVLIVNILLLLRRTKIYDLVGQLIHLERHIERLNHSCQKIVKIRLVKLQVAFVLILYIIILIGRLTLLFIYYLSQHGFAAALGLILTVFLEFQVRLQQLFMQFFVEHITMQYQLLKQLIPIKHPNQKRLLTATFKLHHQLVSLQHQLNRTFGIPCVLFTLMFFLCCAEACYFSLHMLEMDYPVVKIALQSVYLVPGVTLFLGFTYQCDGLSREVSKMNLRLHL